MDRQDKQDGEVEMAQRTITLVLVEDGQMQIITGGELTPNEGMIACRAAGDWFQQQAVDAEVRRRVEEMKRDHQPSLLSETPVIDG